MTTPSPAAYSPLWPQPIPVLGLTGEKWSGKTLFGLTIDPKRTLIYDTEKSSLSYQAKLDFTRIDVMAEMLKKFPKGHKPIDRFCWWLDHVRSIQPGQYSVIVCDTVNEIEGGLADWVEAHPEHFGHTRPQYVKMSGLKWQDVKDYWLSIIAADLSSRCETFVFVTHMGDVWGDNKPTGKRKPKGKDTLFQLASLYLQMQRTKDAKGNLPQQPAAVVLKDRIADFHTDPKTGEIRVIPLMPPRLPVATPYAVRRYMAKPPDLAHLKEAERAPEEQMTEDERAAVRLATAEAERDAAQMQIEKMDRQERRGEEWRPALAPRPAPASATVATPSAALANGRVKPNGDTPPESSPPSASVVDAPKPPPAPPVSAAAAAAEAPSANSVREETPARLAALKRLGALKNELFGLTMPQASAEEIKTAWAEILQRRGVTTARDLTNSQLSDLTAKLGFKVNTFSEAARAAELAARGVGVPADCPF